MSFPRRTFRIACLAVAGLALAASARAQGFSPTKPSPQAVYGVPQQAPTVLYQGAPFTPQPIAITPLPPPTPVLSPPLLGSPQASAQGPAPCACYYPQGYCPFPSGNCAFPQGFCPMPQGNCVAPAPVYGPSASGQAVAAPVYAIPQAGGGI
ncbi:hypothetical protein [Paludisphaera mucosa]|uniref:Uncharacterized protein n=1 Tax=Paludisphaera mucosa TaxID=3030827 RepID=A0ABT6FDZ0_9BACT|nr:hypothetical protein [Paludisphaera mucosa]MDG3005775.1 hypothetical protein [Paludisphaera mucosa]